MNQCRNLSFRSIHPFIPFLRKPLNLGARKIHSIHVKTPSQINQIAIEWYPTPRLIADLFILEQGWWILVGFSSSFIGRQDQRDGVWITSNTRETRLFSLHCCITSARLDEASETGEILECHFIYLHVQFRSLTRQTRRNGHCSRERDDSIVHVNVLISRWSWGACFFSRRSRKIELINFNRLHSDLYLKEGNESIECNCIARMLM